jgi:hypothetical protein
MELISKPLTARKRRIILQKKNIATDDVQSLNGISQLLYRVKLVNPAAVSTYSPDVLVKRKTTDTPVKVSIRNNQLYISGTLPAEGVYQADVYTIAGQAIRHLVFTATAGYNSHTLPLNTAMPAGYIIHLSGNKGYSSSILSVNQD